MNIVVISLAVFIFSAAAIGYVYAGYPLLVFLLSRVFPKPVKKADGTEPLVTVVITAFNEERDIAAKLENTLLLDYPKEKLEIIVASDCSNDRTDEIVLGFADRGVRLVRQPQRLGKTAAQNLAVENAGGEIILFSDATSMYRPDVLRKIVPSFSDETVGCVAGRLIYVDPAETAVGDAAKSYWGYETFLKQNESLVCSLIGVSGCIYAVRRAAYEPMYNEACSDFLIATVLYKQGLRTIYEPEAVCTEETNSQSGKEMRMRIRVISQTFTDLWRNREMMSPFRSGFYAVQLISHKLLRYGIPVFLLLMLVSSGVLSIYVPLFLVIFIAQAAFYLAAAAAWVLEMNGRRAGPLSIPFYFVLANAASVAGFIQFLRGQRYASWEPIREGK